MKTLLFCLLSLILVSGVALATCSTATFGPELAGQTFGVNNAAAQHLAFYYDYENSTNVSHDPLDSGCQGFSEGAPAFGIITANGNIRMQSYNWGNNGACTLTACPVPVAGTSRNVAVFTLHDISVSPYTTSVAIHLSNAFSGGNYVYTDAALATDAVGAPTKFFNLAAPAITAGTVCSGGTCNPLNLSIPNPTNGNGIYGNSVALAIISGYKIWKFDAAAGPANGNEGAAVGTWQDTGQYIPFTAGVNSTGSLASVSATTSGLFIGYEVVFTDRAATATATLAGRGARTPRMSPPSTRISPTPVTFSSFSGVFSNPTTVHLTFVTASESNVAGFNIYASKNGTSGWQKVNPSLIPPQGVGGGGATYTYDKTGIPGTVNKIYFRVDEIDVNNKVAGSASATVDR